MEALFTHIEKHLSKLIENVNDDFQVAFSEMKNSRKEDYKTTLRYIDTVLYSVLDSDKNSIKRLHLHLHCTDSVLIDVLREYIIVREHYFNQNNDVPLKEENLILSSKIKLLNQNERRLEQCPAAASGRNGGNRIYKKWREEKVINRSKLKFFNSFNSKSSFGPKSLINCQIRTEKALADFLKKSPFATSVYESGLCYNITNTDLTLEDIDRINSELIEEFQAVILYNCERKTIMQDYNSQEIETWNRDFEADFQRYLVVTFSKKSISSNNLFNRLKLVKERFLINDIESYTILNEELNLLKGKPKNKYLNISFIGTDSSAFWEDFCLETKIHGLYELRSIKMMNVFSLCFNQEIKEYILAHIFSTDKNHTLITEDTKQDIFNLPSEDIQKLKDSLSNVLDIIINTNLESNIKNNLSGDYKIVVDDFILKNEIFLNLVKNSINVRSFLSWDDLEENIANEIIILSYRDQGNFNYHFYPNINEITVPIINKMKCLFFALFFKKNYEWSKYNLAKDYYKALDNPIRHHHFNWDKLKNKIQKLKPEKNIDISWDLESDYSASETRITYITVFDNKHSTCNPSDLHIYYEDDKNKNQIQPIRWIYENLEPEENKLFVQNLDELIEEFNPAERLVDIDQQKNDLQIIRNQFDLGEESAGHLWKILLARKVDSSSVEEIYKDLTTTFNKNNLYIVSKSHFKSTWINPDSPSLVPKGNKVFKLLCKYLGLPTTYLRIIYTIKNKNISGRRNATLIYSKLLKNLFNNGCFDEGANPEQILTTKIDHYKNKHNLDELGIDEENPLTGLITLVELIKPELSFKEVKSIEKREE